MLERFLEIKSAISKALIDIKEQQILTNVEFETLTAIETGLKPVKIGLEIEKLCSRKRLFTFIIGELNQQNSEFAKNMKCSLVQRTGERRNTALAPLGEAAVEWGGQRTCGVVRATWCHGPGLILGQGDMKQQQQQKEKDPL
ncbi:hypothetical protein AVEN_45703-1 [Araneus ventricosus]|uniref:Uncharacterized protein n=1 Tax=Araneus ventricosus TaxID=182803 RepID=A0A4Y2VUJ0_ARAVE|nr:hypothetical protein AVEN_45703-1 [Araneus ventricosus]